MQLLISDANVLIDLEDGRVLETCFSLPFQFQVPDVLYVEELCDWHSHLLQLGLSVGELSAESVVYAVGIRSHAPRLSQNDCFALALACQEQCPLLTGDAALRKVAEEQLVEVRGTIWLVEQMVGHALCTTEQARDAYHRMKECGSRLPWGEAFRRLKLMDSVGGTRPRDSIEPNSSAT